MHTNTTSSSDLSRGPFSATKLVSIYYDVDFPFTLSMSNMMHKFEYFKSLMIFSYMYL